MTEITCKSCGRAMDSSLKVCPGCGAKVASEDAPDAAFTMAPDDDVPTIEVEDPPAEEPAADAAAPRTVDDGTSPAPVEIEPGETGEMPDPEVPDPEVEGEEGGETEPRGDTVQMSLADATKAWIEDSDTEDEPSAPPAGGAKSNLAVLVGVVVILAAAAAVVLLVL